MTRNKKRKFKFIWARKKIIALVGILVILGLGGWLLWRNGYIGADVLKEGESARLAFVADATYFPIFNPSIVSIKPNSSVEVGTDVYIKGGEKVADLSQLKFSWEETSGAESLTGKDIGKTLNITPSGDGKIKISVQDSLKDSIKGRVYTFIKVTIANSANTAAKPQITELPVIINPTKPTWNQFEITIRPSDGAITGYKAWDTDNKSISVKSAVVNDYSKLTMSGANISSQYIFRYKFSADGYPDIITSYAVLDYCNNIFCGGKGWTFGLYFNTQTIPEPYLAAINDLEYGIYNIASSLEIITGQGSLEERGDIANLVNRRYAVDIKNIKAAPDSIQWKLNNNDIKIAKGDKSPIVYLHNTDGTSKLDVKVRIAGKELSKSKDVNGFTYRSIFSPYTTTSQVAQQSPSIDKVVITGAPGVRKGEKAIYSVNAYDADGKEISPVSLGFRWQSSNEGIIKIVDKEAEQITEIKGIAPGGASLKVFVTYQGKEYSSDITVKVTAAGATAPAATTSLTPAQRDSQRLKDIASIKDALEKYRQAKGVYPDSGGAGAQFPNPRWTNSTDTSWDKLAAALKPYLSVLPKDPQNLTDKWSGGGGFNYAYFSRGYGKGDTCQWYMLVYHLEEAGTAADQGVKGCNGQEFKYGKNIKGVYTVGVLSSSGPAQARDEQRKEDLQKLKTAIKKYYQKTHRMPATDGWIDTQDYNKGVSAENYKKYGKTFSDCVRYFKGDRSRCLSNESLAETLLPAGVIDSIPKDPGGNNKVSLYMHEVCRGNTYLYAKLEAPTSADKNTMKKPDPCHSWVKKYGMNYRVEIEIKK